MSSISQSKLSALYSYLRAERRRVQALKEVDSGWALAYDGMNKAYSNVIEWLRENQE